MTAKRDLKRRVRQRQARTGESYVTARRRVLAARGAPTGRANGDAELGEMIERDDASDRGEPTKPGATIERDDASERGEQTKPGATIERDDTISREESTERGTRLEREAREGREGIERGKGEIAKRQGDERLGLVATIMRRELGELADPTEPGEAGLPVVELRDVTGEARVLGFRCRITVYPTALEACELGSLLIGLQDALVRTAGDTGTARMFAVAFGLPSRPFVQVVAEPYRRVSLLRFTVSGRRGLVEIACRLWLPAPTLILRLAEDAEPDLQATRTAPLQLGDDPRPGLAGPSPARLAQEFVAQLAQVSRLEHAKRPRLFVVDDERRHLVTRDPFVIGRARAADLTIREGLVSRKHAAVVFRNGTYYVKDLGSVNGIEFKGMHIDNKRIDEGDVFRIGTHDLRFTYRDEG